MTMAEYDDATVPMNCGECDAPFEGIPAMIEHVLAAHPEYTPEQAAEYVQGWAESAYEAIDAYNIQLAEEYRRNHRNR